MPSVIDALLKGVDLDPVLAFYVQRLLRANAQAPGRTGEEARPRASLGGLSEREMEVLRLLGDALPNKKIARTLGVSPDTVKFHLKNIYGKLGVSGRDEAVARYRDLTT
jgi:LuxR family maltose regulon positive regulatory protein